MHRTLFPFLAALALLSAPAEPAGAASFIFSHEFDVGAYGPSGGTPRGITTFGGNVLVSDALDDQVYEANPSTGALVNSFGTDPFTCPTGSTTCVPTQEWARVAWDLTWNGTNIWMVDKTLSGGSMTWLIQLNAAGEFLDRFDISSVTASPRGLEVDPRNGDLLLTESGSDFAHRFDISGASPVHTAIYSVTGSTNPSGIAAFGSSGTFFVADPANDGLLEYALPTGSGSSTLQGTTTLLGSFTAPGNITSVAYDDTTGLLYILDNQLDRVLVFAPEPGTAGLVVTGLLALAARRRPRRQAGAGGRS